ncbi:MAG: twin-arginine translocase TatA/TatE family subunit [Acidimicrobiales bacterium]
MHVMTPAEIFGVDGIIILIVVVMVLFGSTQIPKLARSLGSAQKEFKKGIDEGSTGGATGTTAGTAVTLPSGNETTESVRTGETVRGSSS